MTLRTYRNFRCKNGHEGVEKTSENDQPYSKCWETVTLSGMREAGTDTKGSPIYLCAVCGEKMD